MSPPFYVYCEPGSESIMMRNIILMSNNMDNSRLPQSQVKHQQLSQSGENNKCSASLPVKTKWFYSRNQQETFLPYRATFCLNTVNLSLKQRMMESWEDVKEMEGGGGGLSSLICFSCHFKHIKFSLGTKLLSAPTIVYVKEM